ncbi:MAG: 5-formaminoimidazole-4-carboxamide-1-(beta)-D-ribofuranosyl 5'-monophosphate synthetase [Parcubacteria group bacterium Gr01-1014_30]|nr:MAG: 5-formaminoimidazole-4-carboxamide-1-(beta)-D-ribofuranosyl 5'-monophosphate synthetase [Parcubacteria group bacterium Gr01-1014_30]
MDLKSILRKYDLKKLTLTVLGSHSALDLCSGAKKQGFKTLVVCQKGREKVYENYYLKKAGLGCVDEVLVLDSFKDILKEDIQEKLREKNALFFPHRSFQVYLDFDYETIEKKFEVPLFGNRYLLKIEEKGQHPNQYDLLLAANIKIPRFYKKPEDIDRPVMVKVLEKERGFERAFFLASNLQDFRQKSEKLISENVFTKEALDKAVIEEFIAGVQVNLNYFYSPIHKRLEFMGSDTRRQTNIEGLSHLPSPFREDAEKNFHLKFEEAGHIAATLLESMLADVFEIGERFVETTKKFSPPGVIGPFALQTFVVPGPPKKSFVVFDVSCRLPGSPGIVATPYTGYLWGKPVSTGERCAMEVKRALEKNALPSVLT